MSDTYNRNNIFDMAPAHPGMLADTGFTDKVTHPAAGAINFGRAVSLNAQNRVVEGGTAPIGVALHDHTIGGIYSPSSPGGRQNGYAQFDAVSVIKRGRVWVEAVAACTRGAAARFDANGRATTAGTVVMNGARFLTADMTINTYVPEIGSQRMVLVELAEPTIDAIA